MEQNLMIVVSSIIPAVAEPCRIDDNDNGIEVQSRSWDNQCPSHNGSGISTTVRVVSDRARRRRVGTIFEQSSASSIDLFDESLISESNQKSKRRRKQ